MPSKVIHFKEIIQKMPPSTMGSWHYIDFPEDAYEVFGKRNFIKVKGFINEKPFKSNLFPKGNGLHAITIPLKLQKESFLIKNITKLKSVNNKLLVLVCYSFLYLIYSWISSNFSVCISIKYYYLNLILLSLEFIIISFILIKLFINYKKETKI